MLAVWGHDLLGVTACLLVEAYPESVSHSCDSVCRAVQRHRPVKYFAEIPSEIGQAAQFHVHTQQKHDFVIVKGLPITNKTSCTHRRWYHILMSFLAEFIILSL